VTIGVDLSKMHTIGDLQGGIEEAERLLGFTVLRRNDPARSRGGLTTTSPLLVSILRQGDVLLASINAALDDRRCAASPRRCRADRVERCRGVIIDVAALDVLDSYGAHTLGTIAEVAGCAAPRRSSSGSARDRLHDGPPRHEHRQRPHGPRPRAGAAGAGAADRRPSVTAPDPAVARERLQRDYRPAFLRYLSRRDEPARHAGT
jgi:hypothetical protein